MFKNQFGVWEAEAVPMPGNGAPAGGNVARRRSSADAKGLVSGMMSMASNLMNRVSSSAAISIDGTTTVYRIEGFEKVQVDESMVGQFFAGDSYIIQYEYEDENKKKMYILYFWLGAQSSQDEKGAAALHTTKMDDMLGGAATQVRVVMGKEPTHFIRLFRGKMVIHAGGKASGFKNKADKDSYDTDGISLFHVRGFDEDDTRAVQVAEKASSLSAGDCFVLLTPGTMYLWFGSESNGSEQDVCRAVGDLLKAKNAVVELNEGEEPDAFWEALGGKGEYPTGKITVEGSREPLLFSCSNATGKTVIEPVYDFSQADLEEDDVYILDTFTTVWIWIGEFANAKEVQKAAESAQEYIKANGYGDDTSVVTVKSGAEPAIFTCHFLGWTPKAKSKFVDPYEAKLAAINASNPPDISDAPAAPTNAPAVPPIPLTKAFSEPGGEYTFNYEQLKVAPEQLPAGIDPTKREQYLSDAEFEKVLGSPRSQFNALKPWKQQQLKKAAGLF